ncbi:hypothetical protein GF357_03340 [Candidatus Dojkabacteria bacterium]|nr:hypothetical protein [Candidatus Dojkabacteria bacterium]
MDLGINDGVLFRILEDRHSASYLNYLSHKDIRGIELACLNEDYLCTLEKIHIELYSEFEWFSLHMPCFFNYDTDRQSRDILRRITNLQNKFNFIDATVHFDKVSNWDVFMEFPSIPISIENMDKRAASGHSVEEITSVLNNYPFGLTLDLQHCYELDHTMQLAYTLIGIDVSLVAI